jgi:hypothetical protein
MKKWKEILRMIVELLDRIYFWLRNRFCLIYACN